MRKKTNKELSLLAEFESYKQKGTIESYKLPALDKKKCGRYVTYKPIINGIQFDSALEAQYFIYLLEMQDLGHITEFKRQETFELQPKFIIGNKKVRPISYVADFVITWSDGTVSVIDVKGKETPEFKLKRKLFEYKFRMQISCIQLYNGKWTTLEEIKKDKKKRTKSK